MQIVTLSPIPLDDVEKWCDICEDQTLHVSYITEFQNKPGVKGYLLECEPCMLSIDWH